MIRLSVVLIGVLLPGMAMAHPGHLADLAGHDHWVAGIAIGLAGIAGLIGWLGSKDDDADDASEADGEIDAEEATA